MPFELQPTLQGELLELRPLRPEDFDDLYAVASDPLIWEQHPDRDRSKEDVFREFFRVALESGGAVLVVDSRVGRVIGSSRFHGCAVGAHELMRLPTPPVEPLFRHSGGARRLPSPEKCTSNVF